ncbi:hypothetical protein ACP4OV_003077 [Aristida adscensionis]
MSKLKPTGSLPLASRLPDEMLMEVFLHLPPEPGHLLAASLVCKRWCHLVRNGAFLGRFRQLHGTPPLLGFFDNLVYSIGHRHPTRPHSPRFIATVAAPARVRFTVPERMRVVLDSNRGRLLLYNHAGGELLVWDPMTGASRSVVTPRAPPEENAITAALVCAAGAHEDDDAGGQPGQFQIIVVMSCRHLPGHPRTGAWVYSSEAGAWGDVIPVQAPPPIMADTNVHAGDCIYWLLNCIYWPTEATAQGSRSAS